LRGPGPDFALAVPSGGYAWWYVDGVSGDGAHGVSIIAFVGSVFSPYYRRARAKGVTNPEDFCAINVAIYSRGAARWTMTERAAGRVTRDADTFTIGPSAMHFDGATLVIDIEERGFPIIVPVRGQIRVTPLAMPGRSFALDDAQRHHWRPIAPVARIDVDMRQPALRWSGSAYLDHNHGREPIEDGFRAWDWSRSDAGREAFVLYDTQPRQGAPRNLALRFCENGELEQIEPPPRRRMAHSLWGIARCTRSEADASITRTLVDAPFYARSLMQSRIAGRDMIGMHESLSLDRLTLPVVQAMLPFKMPRLGNRRGFFY
jgi:carotenoid 1,2-hydratase